MGSEWIESTVGSLCKNVTSGGTPRSSNESYYTDGTIPWLNTKEVNFQRIYRTEKNITQEGLDNSAAKWIPENSVIVAMYGATAGKVATNEIPLTTNQACCNLIIDDEKADHRFVYYHLSANTNTLLELANGAAQQNLNAGTIKNFPIPLPPLPEQKAIAHILGTLDDKIELNRRMNATLEGMAQALFKSWFVDFDPVIDNALAAGNPIPEELAPRAEVRRQALAAQESAATNQQGTFDEPTLLDRKSRFPAAFQFTEELGWIPEGWEVKLIDEVAEKIGMGPFGSRITRDNFVDVGVPVIRGGNLTNGFVDKDFVYLTDDKATELKSANVFPGDIIFTHRGTIGQVGIIPTNSQHPRYVVSQSQMFLRINPQITSSAYAFSYFKSGSGMERLLGYASQVGVPAIARPTTSLKSLPILIPEQGAVEAFDIQNTSYVNKINACNEQNEALAKLRDTLLPNLISGDLRIPNNEKVRSA